MPETVWADFSFTDRCIGCGICNTYADSTDEAGLEKSRMHRAFGGYSMGGVTTWEVLAQDPQYFAYFMPMAGDCWLDRSTDADGDTQMADLLAEGLQSHG